jgi:AcrR family transcriptional regulator
VYRYFPDKGALFAAASETLNHAEAPPVVPAADARTHVLEAALTVFSTRGIHATTLREIAEQAGLSLSGLQWHFKNKEELVAAIADHLRLLPVVTAEAEAAASDAAPDLESQLTHIAQTVLATFRERPGMLRLVICEAQVYPDVARLASTQIVQRAFPLLTRIFEMHARRGTLRPGPAAVRAHAFISLLYMLILTRPIIGSLLPDDETCVREHVQLLLHGVTAQPRGETAAP